VHTNIVGERPNAGVVRLKFAPGRAAQEAHEGIEVGTEGGESVNCGRMPRRSMVTRSRIAAAVGAASVAFAARIQPPLHSRVDATGQLRDALPQRRHVIARQGVKVGLAQSH